MNWEGRVQGRVAGSAPKRGTSFGTERSLSAGGTGGTCLISFLLVPPSPPRLLVLTTFCSFLSLQPSDQSSIKEF